MRLSEWCSPSRLPGQQGRQPSLGWTLLAWLSSAGWGNTFHICGNILCFFCWIWLSWQCITVQGTYSVYKQILDIVCSIVSEQGQATCKSELNLSAWSLQYFLAWVDDKQGAKKRRASRSCQVLFHACLLSCFIQDKLICISTSKLMKCATNLLQFLCENFHFLYFF